MTATINFSGLGSSIDFSKVTDAIVAERSAPVVQLQNKTTTYTSRSDSLKQLNSLLATLSNTTKALSNTDLGTSRTASSTDSGIVAATVTTTAATGTTSLDVTRLATAFRQTSKTFGSKSDPVLAPGTTEATLELKTGGISSVPPVTITIDSTNNSLEGLQNAINNAKGGVTASIVDVTGNGSYQLVLASEKTGAVNRVELVDTAAPTSDLVAGLQLERISYTGDPADLSTLDAKLKIDGLTITRPTNTISDAVPGATFNLRQTGQATITVAASSDIQSGIQNFVSAYNNVQSFILGQYTKDASGKPTGVLVGDSTLRSVQQQLRDSLSASSTENGGSLKNLSDLGVGRDADGKLTLDSTVLNDKVSNSLADVKSLLAGSDSTKTGIAQSFYSSFSALSDNVTGTVLTAINGYTNSIKSLNKSINDQLARVNQLRDSLTAQFAKMDAAIGQINSQGTTLSAIITSMNKSNNN